MNTDEEKINGLTETIIGCAFRIHNTLGGGFLEKVYENSLVIELGKAGLQVAQQVPIVVRYESIAVSEYVADLVVEGCILIELKAIESLVAIHAAQCINYLAATQFPLCLLINFGRRVEVKRIAGPTFNPRPAS